jgi:glycosyltransferase involved in cell wall biosynthesis
MCGLVWSFQPVFKGIPELVLDDVNGLLVEPRSTEQISAAVKKIFSDSKKYNMMSVAAMLHCSQIFTTEVHQEAMLNCILGEGLVSESALDDILSEQGASTDV